MKITKEFSFEASHRLPTNDKCDYGPCNNQHGHSYKLFVGVHGDPDPDTFMLINFKDLKQIVNKEIIDKLDHTNLNESVKELWKSCPDDAKESYVNKLGMNETCDFIDEALLNREESYTTCEVMATLFKIILEYKLDMYVSIKLYETATSYCEV